mgnify:CR=1 FL=1
MGRFEFNIDTDETVVFANKLERLHRAAFPNAIRGTINAMAFDVKKNTMPKSSLRFVNREKNFFKANSRVDMARGFDTNNMEARVGFVAAGNVENKKSIEDLEAQEHGGVVGGRRYIPINGARISKSRKKKVAKKNRRGQIDRKSVV